MRLSELERSWAKAAFVAIFPEGSALPHGIERLNADDAFARTVASAPFEQAIGLRVALWLIALAPIWLLRRAATLADLPVEERARVLERLLASSIYVVRQLTFAFKGVAALIYGEAPLVRSAMLGPPPAPSREGAAVPPPLESGTVVARTRQRMGDTRAA